MHNDCACITQLLRKGYIIVKMEWISVNKKLPQCEGWFLVSLGNEWDKNGLGKINKDKKYMIQMLEYPITMENLLSWYGCSMDAYSKTI